MGKKRTGRKPRFPWEQSRKRRDKFKNQLVRRDVHHMPALDDAAPADTVSWPTSMSEPGFDPHGEA